MALKGFVCPVLAIVGALTMVSGGVLTGCAYPVCFAGFLALASVVVVVAVMFANKQDKKQSLPR